MSELEKILELVEELELEMVEEGVISDEGHYSQKFETIKVRVYAEMRKKQLKK